MPSLRFHVADLASDHVLLGKDESQHARKVMRIRVGDAVELFDGAGAVATATVSAVGRDVELRISERRYVPRLKPVIDLAVAMPKGDRAAVLVEKAGELGADRLIPLVTERSVVHPREGKLERLRRIATESAKQSGRAWLTEIAEPVDLGRLLAEADHDAKLITDTTAQQSQADGTNPASCDRVIVLVGPEGGWTHEERCAATAAGFRPWRLGPYILRIETAALAALAILRRGA